MAARYDQYKVLYVKLVGWIRWIPYTTASTGTEYNDAIIIQAHKEGMQRIDETTFTWNDWYQYQLNKNQPFLRIRKLKPFFLPDQTDASSHFYQRKPDRWFKWSATIPMRKLVSEADWAAETYGGKSTSSIYDEPTIKYFLTVSLVNVNTGTQTDTRADVWWRATQVALWRKTDYVKPISTHDYS